MVIPKPLKPEVVFRNEPFSLGEFQLEYAGMRRYNALIDIRKSGKLLVEGIELEMKREKRIPVESNLEFRITVHMRNNLYMNADIVLDDIIYF